MTYTDSNFDAETAGTFNPFPGLRPFETDEYTLFFGREGQSDELLARLGRTRFLAVVGTSGSGKSSLIRAGLLPALHGGLMAGAGSAWRVALFRPGGDPVGNLAAALCSEEALGGGAGDAEVRAAIVEATLRRSTLGLVDVVRQARLKPYENLLVVVDQFEELFRFRASREAQGSEDDAAAFVKLLLEAPQQEAREELAARRKQSADYEPPPGQEVVPIYVVLTMRSDFLGDCAQFQGLPEAINDGQYLIPRMTRDERRAAITGPAAVGGGEISLPLVNRLLNDVGDNPDQLPIMQHALMRTWDHWAARCENGDGDDASCGAVELSDYEAVGTMTDALSRHADEAFNELPDERSRLVAEKMFKALTEKGADNREIRRPATLAELCEIAEATPEEVSSVVETFRREGRSFLMPPAGTPLTAGTVIDISHESLIRNWERLKKWVDEEAQSARIYRRVAEAATLHGAGQESLASGAGLQVALDWRDKARPNSAWASHYHPAFEEAMAFLDESKAAHEAAIAETERQREEQLARERRELEQAQKFAAEQQRAAQRLRRMIFAMVLVSLIALGAAGGAAYAYADARASRFRAEGEKERAEAESTRARLAEQSAVEQRRQVEEERNRAREAEQKAEEEQERAIKEEAHAREQEAIARRNAEAAARSAEDARRQAALAEEQKQLALDKTKQVEAAVQRGEMIRSGLEAFRREDFAKALDNFKQLQAALKEFQPGQPSSRNVPPEQLKQFVRDYGWIHTHIGDTHFRRRELPEAVAAYEGALPILASVVKPDEHAPILFETYHGLAHAYHALAKSVANTEDGGSGGAGKSKAYLGKAEEFFNRALDFQLRHEPGDPLESAAVHLNLARLYVDAGRPADAVDNYRRVFQLRRQAISSLAERDKPAALRELAAVYKELAEFHAGHYELDKAVEVYGEMIAILEEVTIFDLPEAAPAIADSYTELGQLYHVKGDEAKAEDAFQAALLIQRIALNIRRETVSGSGEVALDEDLDQLGDLYVKFGKFNDAQVLYRDALNIRNNTVANRGNLWKSYEKLATLYRQHMKEYEEAAEYGRRLVEAHAAGKNNAALAAAAEMLGSLYADDLKKYPEAETELERSLAIRARSGNWHELDAALVKLADVYRRQSKDVEPVYARRLAALDRFFQASVSRILTRVSARLFETHIKAVGDIADFYAGRGNGAQAAAAYRHGHENVKRLYMEVASSPAQAATSSPPVPASAALASAAGLLEKYLARLRDANNETEAKAVEETLNQVRARQQQRRGVEERQQREQQQQRQQPEQEMKPTDGADEPPASPSTPTP